MGCHWRASAVCRLTGADESKASAFNGGLVSDAFLSDGKQQQQPSAVLCQITQPSLSVEFIVFAINYRLRALAVNK